MIIFHFIHQKLYPEMSSDIQIKMHIIMIWFIYINYSKKRILTNIKKRKRNPLMIYRAHHLRTKKKKNQSSPKTTLDTQKSIHFSPFTYPESQKSESNEKYSTLNENQISTQSLILSPFEKNEDGSQSSASGSQSSVDKKQK